MKLPPFSIISILVLVCSSNINFTNAININLSSLWDYMVDYLFDESNNYIDIRSKLVVPRKDLIQELGGEENYNLLVRDALGDNENKSNDNDDKKQLNKGDNKDDQKIITNQKFGVDISFPMQHLPSPASPSSPSTSSNEIDHLQMKQNKLYQEYIQNCNDFYSRSRSSNKQQTQQHQQQKPCTQSELDRIDMNLNQPQLMQNYTMIGFYKTTIPKKLLTQIQLFWKRNYNYQKVEAWGSKSSIDIDGKNVGGGKYGDGIVNADTHVNHWSSPTYMVHIDNPYLEGGGMELKNYIWHVVRVKLEDWINNGGNLVLHGHTNNKDKDNNNHKETAEKEKKDGKRWTLSPTSMYGIRVYKSGSILAPHVDRLPLVTSAIINVDQDVDEEWPLEVIGHDGIAYNVTMKPGDMLLYESHSIIHGRPYPLKGRYYANIFVHFEPTGHTLRHSDRMEGKDVVIDDAKTLYELARKKAEEDMKEAKQNYIPPKPKTKFVKKKSDYTIVFDNAPKGSTVALELEKLLQEKGENKMQEEENQPKFTSPYYIPSNSEEAKRWNQELTYKYDLNDIKAETIDIHRIASIGKLSDVMYAFQLSPLSILKRDENGWQPIHEAVRSGHLNVIKFLIEKGAPINSRTGSDGSGGSVLWWALKYHDKNHPVVKYLIEQKALNIPPNNVVSKKSQRVGKDEGADDDTYDDDDDAFLNDEL